MRSAIGVAAAAVLGAALGLLATVLIARGYTTADFGFYASMIAAWGVLAPLCSLGLGKLVLRAYTRDERATAAWLLGRGTVLAGGACLIAIAAAAVLGPLAHDRPPGLYLLIGAALIGLMLQEPVKAVFQCRRAYAALSLWLLLQPTARALAAAAGLLLALPFPVFLALLAAAELVLAGAALVVLARFRAGLPSPGQGRARLRHLVVEGLPFALSGMLYMVYYQADIVMLGVLADLDAAGLYQAAFVFIAAAYLLPSVLFQRYLLPHIFAWWERPHAPRRRPLQAVAATTAYGLVAAAALYGLAGVLVTLVFGADYTAAIDALRLLAVAVVGHSAAIALGAYLVTEAGIRAKVRVQAVTALLNIALNLWWIPLWGILGAAAATIATEAVLAAGYALALRHTLRRRRAE